MNRDWDWTWEHWHELPPEEQQRIRDEINEGIRASFAAFQEAVERTAKALRDFGESYREALGVLDEAVK